MIEPPVWPADSMYNGLPEENVIQSLNLKISSSANMLWKAINICFALPVPSIVQFPEGASGHARDNIQLDDLLTNCYDDFWIMKVKQEVSVKKIHLLRSIQYINVTPQQSDAGFHHRAGRLNPAFVGDQRCKVSDLTV